MHSMIGLNTEDSKKTVSILVFYFASLTCSSVFLGCESTLTSHEPVKALAKSILLVFFLFFVVAEHSSWVITKLFYLWFRSKCSQILMGHICICIRSVNRLVYLPCTAVYFHVFRSVEILLNLSSVFNCFGSTTGSHVSSSCTSISLILNT